VIEDHCRGALVNRWKLEARNERLSIIVTLLINEERRPLTEHSKVSLFIYESQGWSNMEG
jgi:hypothetical protein